METVVKTYDLGTTSLPIDLLILDAIKPFTGISRVNQRYVEIPIHFESGECLSFPIDVRLPPKLWFSYDTKNVYYSTPISGAIKVGNLLELTGLSSNKVDKFAEFLASQQSSSINFSEFKEGEETNLLKALLITDKKQFSKVWLEEAYNKITAWAAMVDEALILLEGYIDKEGSDLLLLIVNKARYVVGSRFENVLTLSQRYPGLVEWGENSWHIAEGLDELWRSNYGIDFNKTLTMSSNMRVSERIKTDRFIKRASLLKNWIDEIL